MAKNGLDIKSIQSVLKNSRNGSAWSLCIGAGTSKPVISDWYNLVEQLIQRKCLDNHKIDIDTYKNMNFSADAMLQAVKNNLKLDDKNFIKLLSDIIYEPIRNSLGDKEWSSFCEVHERKNIMVITNPKWKHFFGIRDSLLKDTSANYLAKIIIESIKNEIAPKSILTFNGEALLLAMLNSYYIEDLIKAKNRSGKRLIFDRVVNSLSDRNQERIPYIHCHGVIPINGYCVKKGYKAENKLVFSEDQYLQIANNSFSWQSSSFINACLNNVLVFVGVSLTDANMRRWLSWIHTNKINDLIENNRDPDESTEHFWINKKPKSEQEKLWIEETVAHLGIRLVWIDEWNQVGIALSKMLGLAEYNNDINL